MSNLNEARALIHADLEHARHVADLWIRQVSELEKALEQLDVVGTSRSALHVEYQGNKGSAKALRGPTAMKDANRRGRHPKTANGPTASESGERQSNIVKALRKKRNLAESSTVRASKVSHDGVAKRGGAKAGARSASAKYKDPNSDKTWSGFGRPPAWLVGDRQRYEIPAQGRGDEPSARSTAAVTANSPSA